MPASNAHSEAHTQDASGQRLEAKHVAALLLRAYGFADGAPGRVMIREESGDGKAPVLELPEELTRRVEALGDEVLQPDRTQEVAGSFFEELDRGFDRGFDGDSLAGADSGGGISALRIPGVGEFRFPGSRGLRRRKSGSSQGAGDQQDPATTGAAIAATDRNRVLHGKVAVITGGAQGFGAHIAHALAQQGAQLCLADLNAEGARKQAQGLNERYGTAYGDQESGTFAVEADVSDEASVNALVRRVIEEAGGIDLFVSNAGVLKAGSVMEIEQKDFDLVTGVNYRGFFLCSKHASRAMAIQTQAVRAAADPAYYTDIVQINSKSGLDGSKRNGAYAGSKFGGVGLAQSFALELIEHGIKVNAVCPGNFFEGPLWSDPEQGLFVQYLHAGKVPGAQSVEDVKRFYEAKVPMSRGARGSDVARALLTIVEQQYETGQAVPVTGGQTMLH
jgi:sorbitol-6-phosphate 2-dehydrogenase